MNLILDILNTKQKTKLAFLTFVMIINAIFEILTLNLIFIIINYFTNPAKHADNFLISLAGNFETFSNLTFVLLIIFLIIFFLKTLSQILFFWLQSKTTENLRAELSLFYFKGYLNLPRLFHLRTNISETVRNITFEVDYFTRAIFNISTIIMEFTVLIAILTFLLFVDYQVTLISLVLLTLFSIAIYIFNSNTITKMGQERPGLVNARLKLIIEALSGSQIVKLTGAQSTFLNDFSVHNKRLARIFRSTAFRSTLPKPLFELFILILIILSVSFFISGDNDITSIIPILVTFLAAGYRLVPSFAKIISNIQNYEFLIQSGSKLQLDKEKFKKSEKKIKQLNLDNFRKDLEFINVNFSYNQNSKKEKVIFKNLSLKIKSGDKIGIVGESGSGKSTLIDLIMGFLPPNTGNILIDGNNIDSVQNSWQSKIGCVPQEAFITDDTLKKNIAFGFDENKIEDKKIDKALKISNLNEFVSNLENGIDTFLGQQGIRISGGQRQRVGIARSVFNDPEILIFDEATNALDTTNEKKVIDEIFSNSENKTILIVSHNKDNLKYCNKIYQIKDQTLEKIK